MWAKAENIHENKHKSTTQGTHKLILTTGFENLQLSASYFPLLIILEAIKKKKNIMSVLFFLFHSMCCLIFRHVNAECPVLVTCEVNNTDLQRTQQPAGSRRVSSDTSDCFSFLGVRGQHCWDPHPALLLHEPSCTTDDVILDRGVEEGPEWLRRLQQLRQVRWKQPWQHRK